MAESLSNQDVADIELFVRCFSTYADDRERCKCGRYFHSDRVFEYLEDYEVELIEKQLNDSESTEVEGHLQVINSGLGNCVAACDCWHKDAIRYIKWLQQNRFEVCMYYRLDRQRKLDEAKRLPIVEEI